MADQSLLEIITKRSLLAHQRKNLQASVYQHVLRQSDYIATGNFNSLSSEDLGLLFYLIDEHFFDGKVSSECGRIASQPLSFRLSTRMTSSGGMTTMHSTRERNPKRDFEIAIATTPLFETFRIDTTAKVGGLVCHDRLEALQRIMEHEMVHLIEMLLWRDSNCSANPFREIVRRFFGHVESNHQLLTPRDVARKRLGISVGDRVHFTFRQQVLTGVVNRISKRATVLVRSPEGARYTDGHHYKKYYVPLSRLKRACDRGSQEIA